MRLIDPDRLLNVMGETYSEKANIVPDNLAEGFMQMNKLIKQQPTIEAEPVVHGEWIECNNEKHKRCGNCDIVAFIGLYPFGDANYCPNCGAKMGGKDE